MDLDAKTVLLARRLHKGLGVRRYDLCAHIVRTRLGEIWGVTNTSGGLVALATVIYRLESILGEITDQHARNIAPTIYNFEPDPEMHGLDLGGRQNLLQSQHPGEKRYAKRSTSRIVTNLADEVARSLLSSTGAPVGSQRSVLRPPLPPVPDRALLAIVRRESELSDEVAGLTGPAAFDRMVRRSYTAPVDDAFAAFLTLPALVPLSDTNDLIIARTQDQGDWLCVFSTQETLLKHQAATPGQPWSGRWDIIRGADVVHTVANRWTTVGILVNPPATNPEGTVTALRLTPDTVAELAKHP